MSLFDANRSFGNDVSTISTEIQTFAAYASTSEHRLCGATPVPGNCALYVSQGGDEDWEQCSVLWNWAKKSVHWLLDWWFHQIPGRMNWDSSPNCGWTSTKLTYLNRIIYNKPYWYVETTNQLRWLIESKHLASSKRPNAKCCDETGLANSQKGPILCRDSKWWHTPLQLLLCRMHDMTSKILTFGALHQIEHCLPWPRRTINHRSHCFDDVHRHLVLLSQSQSCRGCGHPCQGFRWFSFENWIYIYIYIYTHIHINVYIYIYTDIIL